MQGWQTIFCGGPASKYFWPCLMGSVSMIQLSHCGAKASTDNTCANKTLLRKQAASPRTIAGQSWTGVYSVMPLAQGYDFFPLGIKDGKGLGGP